MLSPPSTTARPVQAAVVPGMTPEPRPGQVWLEGRVYAQAGSPARGCLAGGWQRGGLAAPTSYCRRWRPGNRNALRCTFRCGSCRQRGAAGGLVSDRVASEGPHGVVGLDDRAGAENPPCTSLIRLDLRFSDHDLMFRYDFCLTLA